mmetsp:Transcript_35048/g.76694  ORF Transcript_35048/g.76694 Transcript_35048/m.76694 type:complete len:224 (-) Transcript_35048:263-934(-)
MAPLTQCLVLTTLATAAAFSPAGTISQRSAAIPSSTAVFENFGLDFAEDQTENSDIRLLGEDRYKQWVATTTDNSFLNRQYNAVRRIRELDLLKKTADLGILAKLEKNGLDLATVESLLPQAEKLGLLSLVANNQQLLINGVAPLLIEPAPLLLPAVAGALDVGPPAFFALAAALAGAEGYLIVNDVEVPFVGLPAGAVAGLLLVPLSLVAAAAGAALASAKK